MAKITWVGPNDPNALMRRFSSPAGYVIEPLLGADGMGPGVLLTAFGEVSEHFSWEAAEKAAQEHYNMSKGGDA